MATTIYNPLLFCLASLLAFGVEPWLAYPKSFAFMRLQLTDPALVYFPVPTPYAQAKLWGLPQAVADNFKIISHREFGVLE